MVLFQVISFFLFLALNNSALLRHHISSVLFIKHLCNLGFNWHCCPSWVTDRINWVFAVIQILLFLILIEETFFDLFKAFILRDYSFANQIFSNIGYFNELCSYLQRKILEIFILKHVSYAFNLSNSWIRKLIIGRVFRVIIWHQILFTNPLHSGFLAKMYLFERLWYVSIWLQSTKLITNWYSSFYLLQQILIQFCFLFIRMQSWFNFFVSSCPRRILCVL